MEKHTIETINAKLVELNREVEKLMQLRQQLISEKNDEEQLVFLTLENML